MTDFQQQIRNAYEHLTNIQRTIADYFLEHLDTIPFKRLEELADLIGVSTTSVIRFTRSIGYQGYGNRNCSKVFWEKPAYRNGSKAPYRRKGITTCSCVHFRRMSIIFKRPCLSYLKRFCRKRYPLLFRQEMSISSEFAATFLWLTIWGTAWDRSSREYIWWTGFPWPIPSRS